MHDDAEDDDDDDYNDDIVEKLSIWNLNVAPEMDFVQFIVTQPPIDIMKLESLYQAGCSFLSFDIYLKAHIVE